MNAHGLMLHHFESEKHPKIQGSITQDEFFEVIKFIGRDNILDADVWIEKSIKGQLGEKDVCITFDDSLLCQYDVALPVLQHFNIKAFWFVYSSVFEGHLERFEVHRYFRNSCFSNINDFYDGFKEQVSQSDSASLVETELKNFSASKYLQNAPFYTNEDRWFRYIRDEILGEEKTAELVDDMIHNSGLDLGKLHSLLWMNNEHLLDLHKKGHVVGLHSYSHPLRMENLSRDKQWTEYKTNSEHLTNLLGSRPRTASYCCNSYNTDTIEILRELGVVLAFRDNMEKFTSDAFQLPREDHANTLSLMRKKS